MTPLQTELVEIYRVAYEVAQRAGDAGMALAVCRGVDLLAPPEWTTDGTGNLKSCNALGVVTRLTRDDVRAGVPERVMLQAMLEGWEHSSAEIIRASTRAEQPWSDHDLTFLYSTGCELSFWRQLGGWRAFQFREGLELAQSPGRPLRPLQSLGEGGFKDVRALQEMLQRHAPTKTAALFALRGMPQEWRR